MSHSANNVNDYDETEVFAVPGVTTTSGEQAYLFSSANSSVVDRHFQWMREHPRDFAAFSCVCCFKSL